jgi:hypothetical protein
MDFRHENARLIWRVLEGYIEFPRPKFVTETIVMVLYDGRHDLYTCEQVKFMKFPVVGGLMLKRGGDNMAKT